MAFVQLAFLKDVPEGKAIHAKSGDGAVALCNVGGEIYAIDGICPHAGGPLGHGALHGAVLVCPYHGWAFDCTNGECDLQDGLKQATYPVQARGGQIWVDL